MAFSKPLPNSEEFRLTFNLIAKFVDEAQAEAMGEAIRHQVLDMFESLSVADGYCRNAGISSRVTSEKNVPAPTPLTVRQPPKTIADAIREYQELKNTSPVTLLHKVLDKLIGLKCPNCHQDISITIE